MSATAIQQLLQQNNTLWQASSQPGHRPGAATGYAALDQVLHYRGWPQAALTELLLSKPGIGEIRLLAPLLARLSQQKGYICWFNPPFKPYAPALIAQGIRLSKLLFIQTQSLQDTIWAAQQALASGSCSAALIWLPAKTLSSEIRKLSLAAKSGNSWGFILRDARLQQEASAAALRLVMGSRQGQQQLSVIKQPGGWAGQEVTLKLFPERAYWNAKAASQWPVCEVKSSWQPPEEASELNTRTNPGMRSANSNLAPSLIACNNQPADSTSQQKPASSTPSALAQTAVCH